MNFGDLEFRDRESGIMGTQARVDFENGYGASVISGPYFYTDAENPYEVAVMLNGSLCYDTPITNDVIGYCNEQRVTELLAEIEALPVPASEGQN